MKLIGVSQRVDIIQGYNERRDSIDQNWAEFLFRCGITPLFIPNNLNVVKDILKKLKLHGLLFTGGNSLVKYGGDAPERDIVENYLIDYSISNNIPLLGVCRGMQVIQDYFGIKLKRVEGHISKNQRINFNDKEETVNSYHNFGTDQTIDSLEVIARSHDGIIKGIKHKKLKIKGIMWHPERIKPFSERDIELIQEFYK